MTTPRTSYPSLAFGAHEKNPWARLAAASNRSYLTSKNSPSKNSPCCNPQWYMLQ